MEKPDLFIGCEAIDLPEPQGIAATWFYIKAQIANTHPGASLPFEPVSATAYSGGYPTGYGRYAPNTSGPPATLYGEPRAYGAAHVQQSGTGYINYFYNFLLTLPFSSRPAAPPVDLRSCLPWTISGESAEPGYYSATLDNLGVTMELAAGHHAIAHRYTFTRPKNAGVLVDVTHGGLASSKEQVRPQGADITIDHEGAYGSMVHYGVLWYFCILAPQPELWERQSDTGTGWLGVEGIADSHLELAAANCATTRAGACWYAGDASDLDLYVGLSADSVANARRYAGQARDQGFDRIAASAANKWHDQLSQISVAGSTKQERKIFATALYHSSLKPVMSEESNHIWRDGPALWSGFATMWDQYKTQLPLVNIAFPEHSEPIAQSFERLAAESGRLPNAVLFADDLTRFENQSRNIAVVTLYDIYRHAALRHRADVEVWNRRLRLMAGEVSREASALRPGEHGQSWAHLLDITYAAGCVKKMADELGVERVSAFMDQVAMRWVEAFDPGTGMLPLGRYYEGGNINYSFRLLHDMRGRIDLCGGAAAFRNHLDRFFGFGEPPVAQISPRMSQEQGIDLGRFDGLNNEVMLETPFAYEYIGETDRTAEVVHAIQKYQFSNTRGGLPGNDDSGALSSWYVWNACGLFPVPGQDIYFISCPLFDTIVISSCSLTINVSRNDEEGPAIYIESLRLNGNSLDRSFVTAEELVAGGTLSIELTGRKGTFVPATLPPSFT